jgi:hypothetical protein
MGSSSADFREGAVAVPVRERPFGAIKSAEEKHMAKKTLKKATKMEPKKALTMHLPVKH